MTCFGKLELSKKHILCSSTFKFAISQYLQTLLCLLGQSCVYDEASQLIRKMMGIDVCSPQIQRVCKYFGGMIDSVVEKNLEEYIPKLENTKSQDTIYVMVDGSFLPMVDKEWKEVKLGRIFSAQKIIPISGKRNEVVDSVYVSHIGGVKEFFPKLERHLVYYRNKVIIGDGAPWIWNWVEDNYPGAIQILDFYHGKEKLVLFAKYPFKDQDQRQQWIQDKTDKLKNNQVEQVISEIKSTRSKNEHATQAKEKLIGYYTEHADRMMYKTYTDKGMLIGSGPIESAHRSVLQQRMKLSGQKWSVNGANPMANLRCYHKSGAWNLIENIIKAA